MTRSCCCLTSRRAALTRSCGMRCSICCTTSCRTKTILLSSHITSDLDKIADEITFIHKGEVLLSEPRDELLDTCGILRCTADQLDALDPSAVRAKRVGAFGCEALVRRDGVPANWSVEPVNIEQIMLFLTRGEDAR